MKIEIIHQHHHHHHFDGALGDAFDLLGQQIESLKRTFNMDTSKLLAAVEREKTQTASLRALVEANQQALAEIKGKLADAVGALANKSDVDTSQLEQVQRDIDKATNDLGVDSDAAQAAIQANQQGGQQDQQQSGQQDASQQSSQSSGGADQSQSSGGAQPLAGTSAPQNPS